jgi:hypothetical protein
MAGWRAGRLDALTVEYPLAVALAEPGQRARTGDGEAYTTVGGALVVEVLAGTTRHATVSVTRVR